MTGATSIAASGGQALSWRPGELSITLLPAWTWTIEAKPAVCSTPFSVPTPAVISLELQPARGRTPDPSIPVWSVRFPQPREAGFAKPAGQVASREEHPAGARGNNVPQPPSRPAGPTRLRPPGDVIKLEDRLYYLLQPPLEMWLRHGALELPLNPFPYQWSGVAFLYPRYAAVLADEMGLGKTMQAITAIRLLLQTGELSSALLVCPKPLVSNWQREFHFWAPEIPIAVIEGDAARRAWLWKRSETPVKIANYEIVVRDRELFANGELQFDLVALDESQRIKNRASSSALVVRGIPRRRSWAITGTPVENSAEDLASIFEFVRPGLLSADMKPGRVGRLAADYILRRTKDQVLTDLPPKLLRDADIELTAAQRESYRLAEQQGVLRLSAMGEAATIQHVFELVLRLKQICNFDPATGESAKLERLSVDLEEVAASGQKAIIFSQWVDTLRRLKRQLARFRPLEFHGQVPSGSRDEVLRWFREDSRASVLLISYGAGGVGLNLQFASYVFLFDRWWNPAIEDQAINRAHRIGAESPVTVTRFLAVETIEERINAVLEQKRAIFEIVLSPAARREPHFASASHDAHGLSREELFGLFKLKCPGGTNTAAAA